MSFVPIPEDLKRDIIKVITDSINQNIAMLYNMQVVPKSFLFSDQMRLQLRERIYGMFMNSTFYFAMETFDFKKGVPTNPNLCIKLVMQNIDHLRYIIQGYLLAFYDLTEHR